MRFLSPVFTAALRPLMLAMTLGGVVVPMAQAQTDVPVEQAKALKLKLTQRMRNFPQIDSVRTTPVPGLLELRVGEQLFYVDAKGDYLISGHVLDTRTQRNLTEERLDEITKVDFESLPLKDAVVWKNGSGKRRLVVFADPNCGYCKQLEKSFVDLKDVTVYTFMVGLLAEDSKVKADAIWCLKDRTQAWRDWMTQDRPPARLFGGMCSTPLQRNMQLAQKLRVEGTPALFFEDGTKLASAAPVAVIEKRLQKASAAVAAR